MKKKTKPKKFGRLAIYVAPEREKVIEQWRKRINFSELFWRAFESETARRKVDEIADRDLRETVDRLRGNCTRAYDRGHLRGVQGGAKWAQNEATLEQLERIVSTPPDSDYVIQKAELLIELFLEDGDWSDIDRKVLWDDETDQLAMPTAFQTGFLDGFVQAVEQLWEKIQPYFASDTADAFCP